jgi:hypothetical protein
MNKHKIASILSLGFLFNKNVVRSEHLIPVRFPVGPHFEKQCFKAKTFLQVLSLSIKVIPKSSHHNGSGVSQPLAGY